MTLRKVEALKREVEVDFPVNRMPVPESLLEKAMKVPQTPPVYCASSYGAVVHVLREKGLTWQECADWLRENGADFTMQAVIAGHRNWLRWEQAKA